MRVKVYCVLHRKATMIRSINPDILRMNDIRFIKKIIHDPIAVPHFAVFEIRDGTITRLFIDREISDANLILYFHVAKCLSPSCSALGKKIRYVQYTLNNNFA